MKPHTFISRVEHFVNTRQLLSHHSLYLLGLSGGADSVALLLAITGLGFKVEAVHCNFHLRGEEADRDEAFCRNLCRQMKVPFHTVHFDTMTYAEAHHVSVEMAARELRYGYFERLRADLEAEGILVAHHINDSVETVLINMTRGTGLHGLCGIAPRMGRVLRPLLCVDREMILQFLKEVGQPFITDSSNLVPDVTRNKIRLEVIPLMEQINPSFVQSVDTLSQRLRSAASLLDEVVEQALQQARLDMGDGGIVGYTLHVLDNEYVAHALLSRYGFSPAQCERIYANRNAATGALFESSSHQLLFDRNRILIQPVFCAPKPKPIPTDGKYVLDGGWRLRVSIKKVDSDKNWSRDPFRATIDADRVKWPLSLRVAEKADRFRPLGMKGSKLLSDFLTDRKVNRFDKQRQLVVSDAKGDILWVVGLRIDDRYKMTETTQNMLLLEYFQEPVS